MRTRRLLPVCCLALVATTLIAGSALAKTGSPSAPQGLKAFLLRANEPLAHEFSRTPAFSWRPVRGAVRYEFQLAKTSTFTDASILKTTWVRSPAAAIPVALPWMTGEPYAAYARVRALTVDGTTAWSKPFGFNVRWSNLPKQLPASPGLSRWTPVEGATSYQVWFIDISKKISARTNAADHREFYAFHRTPDWMGTVRWRVRSVRTLYGKLPSGLPRVTYGPWSPIYTSRNPAPGTGGLSAQTAVSETSTSSTRARAGLHQLTPAFTFDGEVAVNGGRYGLYRVYVFSDRDCVNVIFRGAIVGSPAYAPRSSGPLALPVTGVKLGEAAFGYLPDGSEGVTRMADLSKVKSTESDPPYISVVKQAPGSEEVATEPDPEEFLPEQPSNLGAPVDLWDSGWPNGRFYWTVIAVSPRVNPGQTTTLSAAVPAGATTITVQTVNGISENTVIEVGVGTTAEVVEVASVDGVSLRVTLKKPLQFAHNAVERVAVEARIEYWDVELPQDACAAGRVVAFGKATSPVVAGGSSAYASGLSPQGRLVAARGSAPTFFGAPVVAWEPTFSADVYQIEWSQKAYPWKALGRRTLEATATMLPLSPGTWHYRVRGLNLLLPRASKAMSWSKPQMLRVAKPKFKVIRTAK
jgi:hypothetical protein